jgi:hypothetical protein
MRTETRWLHQPTRTVTEAENLAAGITFRLECQDCGWITEAPLTDDVLEILEDPARQHEIEKHDGADTVSESDWSHPAIERIGEDPMPEPGPAERI